MNKYRQTILTICFLLALYFANTSFAQMVPKQIPLPDLDLRPAKAKAAVIAPEKSVALGRLKEEVSGLKVEFDSVSGSPKVLSSTEEFLTRPSGNQKSGSIANFVGLAADDPHSVTKAFLMEHSKLFGYGPEALDAARISRDDTTAHNGMRTVVWQQQMDDIPVFEAVFISHTTRNGELIKISSQFLSNPVRAVTNGTPNRNSLLAVPSFSAQQAVALAAQVVGEHLEAKSIIAADDAATGPEKHRKFTAPGLKGEADVKLIWLPMDQDSLKLCWEVVLVSRSRGEMFLVLVDVRTGEVLMRRCLTNYISNASYRVYTSDSPTPFSPGWPSPDTNQPPYASRTLLTLSALSTNASPSGWIPDGENETLGNNVDAHTDRDANDSPDLPRPHGSPARVFDFPLDLTQAPSTYTNAAVVQLFYWVNWYHDKLYDLGFTETAGNFQNNNFGRGGLGNDAIQADAQDGSDVNNANFNAPPDGSPGRVQMFLWNGPTPQRDGDFDAEVLLHELTHGLSNRRVGGGVGLSEIQSQGMGEGWSDWYGLALLAEAGDDIDGVWARGAYSRYLLNGLTENYYYGGRRYPYCTDTNINPLTFKDIDPTQASPHSGVLSNPINPNNPAGAAEVHAQGEVWCITLWECRANLLRKYGFSGNQLALQIVTDALALTPADPSFIQARDAIIQADLVSNSGANKNELWAGFAKRGLGFSATSPPSTTTTGVVEAFDLPPNIATNDQCASAIALTLNVSNTENTTNASSTNNPTPDCQSNFGKGVWFTFTTPVSGVMVISSFGSDFDTAMQVYTGGCGALTPVDNGCDDDDGPACSGFPASVAIPNATAGTTYWILVGGYNSNSGNLQMMATVVPPISNDACSGAVALSDNVYYSENTLVATTDYTPGRDVIYKGVWFSYTPDVSGIVTVDTCGSDFDTVLEVMSGSCDSLVTITNNDDGICSPQSSLSFAGTAGTTYLICAGENLVNGTTGNLIIRATVVSPLPDLTVISTVNAPALTNAGSSINVGYILKNNGGSPSGTFGVRLSLGTTTYGTQIPLGDFSEASLAPNEQRTESQTVTIPAGVAAGSYWVTVYADGPAPGVVAESREDNNIGSSAPNQIAITAPPAVISVTVQTSPSGCTITVDGTNYTTAQVFSWLAGSSHTLATPSPQSGGTGIQYVSHSGTSPQTVIPTNSITYTANFTTQYYLTMNAGTGGTVSPASGWNNSGASVPISATVNSGYGFSSWTGSGSGSYSGSSSSSSVTMNEPIAETASFQLQTGSLQVNLAPAGAVSGGAQWQVDGGAWQSSGATISALSAGSHTVAFKIISGWQTPASQTPAINANSTTTATGTYLADVTKPILTITAPTDGQKMTNALAIIIGTASANLQVSNVWYQLNSNNWNQAGTTNNYTNWTTTVTLVVGTNTVKAYAVDLGGNTSITNSVSMVSSNTFQLQLKFSLAQPMTTTGLNFTLQVSPGINGTIQTSSNLVNWLMLTNFVGTNPTLNFRDISATNASRRFYRAVTP